MRTTANNLPPTLQIQFSLRDGSLCKYAQNDPASIQAILKSLNPARLFQGPFLGIEGPTSVTVFPSSQVVRVDLITGADLGWKHPLLEADDVVGEITKEEFAKRFESERPPDLKPRKLFKPGEKYHGFVCFRMSNRDYVIIEVRRTIGLGFLKQSKAGRAVEESAYFGPRAGGGYLFLNPAHIVRLDLVPGRAGSMPFAWPAYRVAD